MFVIYVNVWEKWEERWRERNIILIDELYMYNDRMNEIVDD